MILFLRTTKTIHLLPECGVCALRLPHLRSLSDARNHLRRQSRLRCRMTIVRLPATMTPEQRQRLRLALARVLARQAMAEWCQFPVENEEKKTR
jgi:hypothetical protein